LQELLTSPAAAIAPWLQGQVLDDLPTGAREVLRLAAALGPVSADLIDNVAAQTGRDRSDMAEGFTWLTHAGLVLPGPRPWGSNVLPMGRVIPLVAATVRDVLRTASDADLVAAAAWYAEHGQPLAAAAAWHDAGDHLTCLKTLAAHGEPILASGGAAELVRLAGNSGEQMPHPLRLYVGEALRMSGDMAGARRALQPLVEEPGSAADPALAWRLAMVHYARADYAGADDICRRVPEDAAPSVELVRLFATRASATFMLGHQETSGRLAARALTLATALDDDRALAAAHLASGMVTSGARRDDHLASALLAAERIGHAGMAARILLNQAGNLLVDANFRQAADVAERAIRASQWGSPPATRAAALHNAGEALTRLGQFDRAVECFTRSIRICRGHGLSRTPAALWGLAEVDRQRGRLDAAQASYAEVVDLAQDTGEVQVLVPALLGWVRCLAMLTPSSAEENSPSVAADPLDRSKELSRIHVANETAQQCTLEAFGPALQTISGWIALCEGDNAAASTRAAEAMATARRQRNTNALADALELAASSADDPRERTRPLEELLAIWQAAGADISADQVLVDLAAMPGADPARRADAKPAARRLMEAGIRLPDAASQGGPSNVTVSVRVMGAFEVTVNGQDVPLAAWRSRQARSLLKILAAARGRPLTRDWLCEALWPDDRSDRTGHRLSVLLSAVRNVLDPDRLRPPDHYLRADLEAVRLVTAHVRLDVEDLFRDAREADGLARAGQYDRARSLLADVEAVYRGDAFEDDPYEQWAEGLREEARACWSKAMRLSAKLAQRAGDTDHAVGCLVRLVSADPYDERTHRALVDLFLAAGRHGEARRWLDLWARAMHSLGAPPPDHALISTIARRGASLRVPNAESRRARRRDDPILTPR
jgi:DNA-binding SARP family transcriptional activator